MSLTRSEINRRYYRKRKRQDGPKQDTHKRWTGPMTQNERVRYRRERIAWVELFRIHAPHDDIRISGSGLSIIVLDDMRNPSYVIDFGDRRVYERLNDPLPTWGS